MKVYVLQHVHSLDDGSEDVKFIGVYSSREKALATVARLRRAPGFCDAIEGFDVDEYCLDQDHWVDGYVTGDTSIVQQEVAAPSSAS